LPRALNRTAGRRKVRELTGQDSVPVLVTDEDTIVGSQAIAHWARRHHLAEGPASGD
jgi:hypothetical protein